MRRDPLKILARVREAAVMEATRELAGALSQERAERQALADQVARVQSELAAAGPDEAGWLGGWLVASQAARARQAVAITAAAEQVARSQQALLLRRTDAKVVDAARAQAQAAADTVRRRAEQAALDEAGASRAR